MKLALAFSLVLVLMCLQGSDAWFGSVRRGWDFARGAAKGTADMYRAYRDMRRANWKNSAKYFHARGNRDAARHGPGGRWAAEKISNAREIFDQRVKGDTRAQSLEDQRANIYGRNGGDLSKYRPKGLPPRY